MLTTEQLTRLWGHYIETATSTWDDIVVRLREDEEFSRLVEEGNYINVDLDILIPWAEEANNGD